MKVFDWYDHPSPKKWMMAPLKFEISSLTLKSFLDDCGPAYTIKEISSRLFTFSLNPFWKSFRQSLVDMEHR